MATPIVSDLYLACRNGDIVTVQQLLPGTPLKILNSLEPNGSTCLHAASHNGHKDIVRLLLAHGASRRVVNKYGCTALDEAKTQDVADLFPRTNEASRKRFSDSPAQQLEWQFSQNSAESFSRALHWNCVKDRGIKKTVKKIRKAHVLDDDGDESAKIVQDYFNEALETKNPICLLKAYTVESQFYKRLNREMATGSDRKVFIKLCKKWTGYYTGIIVKNPAFEPYRYSGETYRGMQITQLDYQQYQVGVALSNKSFQSTSKSWKIAKDFACPQKPTPGRLSVVVIFTIVDRRSALSIETISEFQNEAEVLIVPGTLFIVKHINQNEVPYEVEVEQIPWNDEF
jgi:hypothetical protein